MTPGTIEAVLRRDRLIVAAALAAITLLAWIYLLWLSQTMAMPQATVSTMPDMPGMNMAESSAKAWGAGDFAFMFAMWAVMMVGMMTPSVAPMILIYARVARQAALQGRPLAATGWFAGGYFLSWIAFSLFATSIQGVLERAAILSPMMSITNGWIGGLVLIAVSIYQWSPMKNSCLRQCRAPLAFIQDHGGFRKDPAGSLGLGFRHGLYCVGCCWALMALLFAGGVMNVVWIAAIAIFVLIEKLVPGGLLIPRLAGAGFAASGLWMLVKAWTAG